MRRGFSVEYVVHDYRDLCQSIADLAFEVNEPVEVDEFRTLNRCLDNAIAKAVAEYTHQRELAMAEKQTQEFNVHIGSFAHELRNSLSTATLALFAIKDGDLGLNGATGSVLSRALASMRTLIDRTLTNSRTTAGLSLRIELFALVDFVREIKDSASLEAGLKECVFITAAVDPRLGVNADRDLLMSAVGNLLQNAIKFTHRGTEIILRAYSVGDRLLIEVEDHGNGLPPEDMEDMFKPFVQGSADKSGVGLGLSIARRSVEAMGGILKVRRKQHSGCIFTIELPQQSMP